MPKYKKPTGDIHGSVSFSLSMSIRERLDRRVARLRMSRTDYLKALVLWELDKGEDADFDLPRKAAPLPIQRKRSHKHD